MTNEHRVRDLCRQIRGIALNYPKGMDSIAATVEDCMAEEIAVIWVDDHDWAPDIQRAIDMAARLGGGTVTESVSGETQVAGEAGAQLSGRVAPKQTKRKRGRPRKHQVSE